MQFDLVYAFENELQTAHVCTFQDVFGTSVPTTADHIQYVPVLACSFSRLLKLYF